MPPAPVITFKAGICEVDDSSRPYKVRPKAEPGYLYIYKEDDLPHFCWRPRSAPLSDPTLDLIMFPGDGTFKPFEEKTSDGKPLVNGRIYVLRFSSSSARHLFWLQSKTQHANGDPSWFSPRDHKLGEIVNQLLQGEEVNVRQEIANLPTGGDDGGGDDDTAMEDADEGPFGGGHHRAASGGAGAGATGGDIREEGEGSREGGADGGRA
ncbi:MAG: hypothetical protein LQ340_006130 [Diploschistes diacapsis]|nr:MAG: hypothetical protein LQ340_006130 [Diploschistes diacapsis]